MLSAIPMSNPHVEKKRIALSYDYATSGIDYTKGTQHHIGGEHYVLATEAELAAWQNQ